jgi:predicted metal-binding protein
MKIGIIRCQQTEDICPGTKCLRTASQGSEAFESMGPAEVIGFISCGGCPGKKAVARAAEMVKRGAEAIAFSSCITKGIPWQYCCPHVGQIQKSIEAVVGSKVRIVDWTHG